MVEIRQGEKWRIVLAEQRPDGTWTTWTGATISAQVRTAPGAAGAAAATLSCGIVNDVDAGTDGGIEIILHATASALLAPGSYVYDVFVTLPGQEPDCIDSDTIKILARVTR